MLLLGFDVRRETAMIFALAAIYDYERTARSALKAFASVIFTHQSSVIDAGSSSIPADLSASIPPAALQNCLSHQKRVFGLLRSP